MRYIKGIILIVLFSLQLSAQVSVTADIPTEVSKNTELLVIIKFDKGPIKNYSKYELTVPDGMSIKEVDCRYGAFSFENSKMRIIWAITPADPIYTIQVKLQTGSETGAKQLSQTYAYAEKGEKLELEMAKIKFSVVDSVVQSAALSDNENKTTEVVAVVEENKKEAAEIKNETKEAEEIGKAEKLEAEKKIAEAKEELRKAELISNPSEKKAAIDEATQKQRKGEEELAAAERILALSSSLNENANKKENLSQSLDSLSKTEANQNTGTEVTNAADVSHHPAEKIEKAKESAMNKGAEDAQDLYKSIKPEDHHEDLQIEQQVSQLRLDSKDALEVGTREKLKAENALHDAYEALKKTKYIPDAEEKKLAVDKANADIEQAKSDLEIASKILALSKSLEENAKEIERLHLNDEPKAVASNSVNPSSENSAEKPAENTVAKPAENTAAKPVENDMAKTQSLSNNESTQATQSAEKSATNTEEVVAKESVPAEKTAPVEEKKAPENPVKPSEETVVAKTNPITVEKTKENKSANESNPAKNGNMAFTLQLGSFVNSPDMSVFKKLGKVELRTENGKFKVYYGKFYSKQDAVEMRQKTVAKGFDCFVVAMPKS